MRGDAARIMPGEALDAVEAIAAGEGAARSEVLRSPVVEWLRGREPEMDT